MIRVYYLKPKRQGCQAIMESEYFNNWKNAIKHAQAVANGTGRFVLINDFEGKSVKVYPDI